MAAKKILLVEGNEDEHVLKHLCGNRGGLLLDDILPLGGVDQLLDSLPVRLKASEYGDILGVIIDADTDLDFRWRSLKNRLLRVGYEGVPDNPAPEGTILDPPNDKLLPRVGIWIMPDNRSKGILEDFLQFLIPERSELFEHVKTSIAGIPAGARHFSKLAEPKALIHTWLAWQKEPGKSLGTAITARYLDPGVAQVDVLMSWLNRLYFQ
jgi:hypothetical protein